jgi:hypothetical protein
MRYELSSISKGIIQAQPANGIGAHNGPGISKNAIAAQIGTK